MVKDKEIKISNKDVFSLFFRYFFISFIFVLTLFLFIMQSIAFTNLKIEFNKKQKLLHEIKYQNNKFLIEFSSLNSPKRILKIATEKYKMKPAKESEIILIQQKDLQGCE